MTNAECYGRPLPGLTDSQFPGKLIVLEGTDGVGRSTQITLLRNWLQSSGLAVFDTGLSRSALAGRDLQRAKEGHTMGRKTTVLYYATDFADRLETEIVPALRAGYVVLTDRYIYSLIARAVVRGADPQWVRKVYGFALKPSAIFYLRVALSDLVPRVLASSGFDYWESGADNLRGPDLYECFVTYQTALLHQFEDMVGEFHFTPIDATKSIRQVFRRLQAEVQNVVADMLPPSGEFTSFVGRFAPVGAKKAEPEEDVLQVLRELLDEQVEG